MSDVNLDLGSTGKRRTLWIVLSLNVAIAVGFLATGYIGNSTALSPTASTIRPMPSYMV